MMEKSYYSFALQVKEEIASIPFKDELLRPFLSGFTKCNGTYRLGDVLDLSTESSKIAKLLYQSFSSIYGVNVRFSYTKSMNFRKAVKYHCLVSEADYICSDLDVDFFSNKAPKNLLEGSNHLSSYLAGCFLAVGSVNDPKSSNYHLELALSDADYASFLCKLILKIKASKFTPKIASRRKQTIVYLKRGDQISSFLAFIGANQSCLDFENIRIDRDFANIGNRLNNLDSANMEKTLSASSRQIKEIEYLTKKGLFEKMGLKIRTLGMLRIKNPDASLEELSKMMSDELSSEVSKSNVNHIFRKIHEEYIDDIGTDR